MKVIEYPEEFFKRVSECKTNADIDKVVSDTLVKFLEEGYSLAHSRNIQLDDATISLIKELSNKWRAFGEIVNKKYDNMFFIRLDDFKQHMIKHIPELKDKI
jgi:hypothetical protein